MKVKVILGTVGGAGVVLALLWSQSPGRARLFESDASAAPAIEGSRAQAARSTAAGRLAEVEALVEARNRLEPREQEHFRAEGWTLVAAPPPDRRLLALDPALLEGREAELRVQLTSAVVPPDAARNVVAVALATKSAETRFAAVEALGRMQAQAGQEGLRDLLIAWSSGKVDADDPGRRQVPALLHPTALDDPWAAVLAQLIDSPSLGAAEKRQLAFTLALVGLRDGMTLPPEVLSSLSADARALIQSMTQLASAGMASNPTPGGTP